MSTTHAGVVLRHIRGLARPADDRQLLRRFTAGRDEAAFAELVRRHGPLVLGVCRRVLHNAHDADDAFQATFLALARRAASVGRRGSVGGWLHQVAYNAALKAKERAAARQRRERRAASRAPADPLDEVTGRELLAALDEELAALPPRLREPLVLCYLAGKTRDEAARASGCSPGTLKRRLDEGRRQLHERLRRRGLALPAALLGAGAAGYAVPPALAAATARVAAGRAALPTAVAALVRQSLQTTAARVSKAVAAALLGVGLIAAGAGLLADHGPVAAGVAAAAADEPKGEATAPKEPPAPPADEKKEMAFVGRVVGADGQPVAAADVALLGEPKSNPPNSAWLGGGTLAHGRADGDGKFRLTVARSALAGYREGYVIAGKSGHGLAWARAELKAPARETLVRLAPEKVIRGRLLDLQGQPAAGVRVRVSALGRDDVGVGDLSKEGFPAWPGPATTDKNGKFTVAGLSPDLGGSLEIDGEEFTIAQAEIKAGKENRNQEVNLTLSPARILEGVVTALGTGLPVPKARVECMDSGQQVACQTDEKGGYRLRVPSGDSHDSLPSGLSAIPPQGQPYLRGAAPLDWPKGAVKHRIDLALPRGVLVRGTVTDAATGKPVAGAAVEGHAATTADDGTFTVVVAPGRGHLLVKGPNNDYVATEITFGELQGGKRFAIRYYPDAVIPFEAKAGTDALNVTAQLRRGVSIRGKLLGPGDKPVAEALMSCWNQLHRGGVRWGVLSFASAPVRDGTFELRGCDPEETYPVYFLDARNKLGASVRLSAKEAAGKEVTVRLEPCGSAVVRFVDKAGKPLKDFRPAIYMVVRPGDKDVYADHDFLGNIDTVNYSGPGPAADAEGRLTYPALIPGATYALATGTFRSKFKELTVKPGEVLKTDVAIEGPQ